MALKLNLKTSLLILGLISLDGCKVSRKGRIEEAANSSQAVEEILVAPPRDIPKQQELTLAEISAKPISIGGKVNGLSLAAVPTPVTSESGESLEPDHIEFAICSVKFPDICQPSKKNPADFILGTEHVAVNTPPNEVNIYMRSCVRDLEEDGTPKAQKGLDLATVPSASKAAAENDSELICGPWSNPIVEKNIKNLNKDLEDLLVKKYNAEIAIRQVCENVRKELESFREKALKDGAMTKDQFLTVADNMLRRITPEYCHIYLSADGFKKIQDSEGTDKYTSNHNGMTAGMIAFLTLGGAVAGGGLVLAIDSAYQIQTFNRKINVAAIADDAKVGGQVVRKEATALAKEVDAAILETNRAEALAAKQNLKLKFGIGITAVLVAATGLSAVVATSKTLNPFGNDDNLKLAEEDPTAALLYRLDALWKEAQQINQANCLYTEYAKRRIGPDVRNNYPLDCSSFPDVSQQSTEAVLASLCAFKGKIQGFVVPSTCH